MGHEDRGSWPWEEVPSATTSEVQFFCQACGWDGPQSRLVWENKIHYCPNCSSAQTESRPLAPDLGEKSAKHDAAVTDKAGERGLGFTAQNEVK